jgi:glutamine amidotransferase
MTIAVVDYGVGNLGAIPNMLERLAAPVIITSDPEVLAEAERIILPGVGAFGAGMANLHARGLIPVLEERIVQASVPTLGVCLGMQLLFEGSDEANSPGLGWLRGRVVRFHSRGTEREQPIPHMGWAELDVQRESPLLDNLGDEPRFYFAHSYHPEPADEEDIVATATYRYPFAAVVRRGNIHGAQFHPEKSHRFGLQLLKNFLQI